MILLGSVAGEEGGQFAHGWLVGAGRIGTAFTGGRTTATGTALALLARLLFALGLFSLNRSLFTLRCRSSLGDLGLAFLVLVNLLHRLG